MYKHVAYKEVSKNFTAISVSAFPRILTDKVAMNREIWYLLPINSSNTLFKIGDMKVMPTNPFASS